MIGFKKRDKRPLNVIARTHGISVAEVKKKCRLPLTKHGTVQTLKTGRV